MPAVTRFCETVEWEFMHSMELFDGPADRICVASEPLPDRLSISIPPLVLAPKWCATSKDPETNSPVDEPLVCRLLSGAVWPRMLDRPRSDGAPCTPLPMLETVALPPIAKSCASGTTIESCEAAL